MTPAGRAFTRITLLGSVCHVTVVHREPSARSAAGKQQRVEVRLFFQEREKALVLKDQSGLNKGGREASIYKIFHILVSPHFVYLISKFKSL